VLFVHPGSAITANAGFFLGINNMKTPYMPFFVGDYLSDTMGLSCCEHGVYMLLLAVSWQRGPLPNDMDHLSRLAANPPIEALRYILDHFWTLTEKGWINARLEAERERVEALRERRSEAAKKAISARWNKGKPEDTNRIRDEYESNTNRIRDEYQTNTIQNQSQNQSQNHTHTQTQKYPPPGEGSGKRPTLADVADVLEHLNRKTGSAFRVKNANGKISKNAELVRLRIAEHGKDTLIRVIDLKCAQWLNDDKMHQYLRPGTLFRASKCEQYVGELTRTAPEDPAEAWARKRMEEWKS